MDDVTSSSGLPVGPGRLGNRVITTDVSSADAHVSSDVHVAALDEATPPLDLSVESVRPKRTWFDQSLSSIAGCVIVLGYSDYE